MRAAQVIGMEQMVKVYDAVDFLDRNDHPTYVLMRSIKGDVSLSSLANIDLNGYTLDGSVRFGAEAPILAAGDLYIGSGTGGVITGRVYVDAPNAEVYHYGTADSVSIKAAAGYHFYGESKVSFWMQDGTLTIGRDALVESLSVSSKAAAPIKIVNDGVIREFEALVENAAYTPVITGQHPPGAYRGDKGQSRAGNRLGRRIPDRTGAAGRRLPNRFRGRARLDCQRGQHERSHTDPDVPDAIDRSQRAGMDAYRPAPSLYRLAGRAGVHDFPSAVTDGSPA